MVEVAFAITAGNLALVRPLLRKLSQALGLQALSTRPEPHTPNSAFPPTIGAQDKNKGRKNWPDDTIDLLAYPGEDITRQDERNQNHTSSVVNFDESSSVWSPLQDPERGGESKVGSITSTETLVVHETIPK
jgi:hypothetical protein